ncbi:hypothetical protein [Marinomonas sp. FW-1]|uniref:hypothetical protein n=1 Tax=Marinomonas sp. FW-1 TaxID=2071621 RepID=UPI00158633D5|nr:hypothetical protein [Marinomonas sp. FW-1]
MQDGFEAEVGKGNLFTLIKELSVFSKVEAVKKSRVQGESFTLVMFVDFEFEEYAA